MKGSLYRVLFLQTKELPEDMDLKILNGIVDCLWVKGDSISSFKGEAIERKTDILTRGRFL
jgi:DNA polymerase elongation subunit (family B)